MGRHQPGNREALLYRRLSGNRVGCLVCQRRCVIPAGELGYCATRINHGGQLYTLIYGRISTWRVAPAEIKPLFHFYPGSRALSLGSVGCNFRCRGCQNWEIAHVQLGAEVEEELAEGTIFISPEKAVQMAQEQGCQGLSWTYNEPTLWLEYVLEGAKLAKAAGLYTNVVTNGFMTPRALDLLGPHLDAYRVDVKGFSQETYWRMANVEDFSGILDVAKRAKHRWKMHVEVITNVTPGYNDDEQQLAAIANWICQALSPDTPWHVTRFYPHAKLADVPATPVVALERARQIGLDAGLLYVYLGNVPGHAGENTYCPDCGELLIERQCYQIIVYALRNGRCPRCGKEIPIVGHHIQGAGISFQTH